MKDFNDKKNKESLEKPGEFEIGGVEFVLKEIGKEVRVGKTNSIFLDIDRVKVLFLQSVSEDTYEWIKTLPFIDILVVTFTDNLKEIVNKIDPTKIIILDAVVDESLAKKMGVNPISGKQFKFKESDFEQIEDEKSVTEVLILG